MYTIYYHIQHGSNSNILYVYNVHIHICACMLCVLLCVYAGRSHRRTVHPESHLYLSLSLERARTNQRTHTYEWSLVEETSEHSAGLPFYACIHVCLAPCMRMFQCMCSKMATIILFFVSPIELIAGLFYVPLIKWITSSVFVAKQNSLSFFCCFFTFCAFTTNWKQAVGDSRKQRIFRISDYLFKCYFIRLISISIFIIRTWIYR